MREIKFRFWDAKRNIMFDQVTLLGLHWESERDPSVYVGSSEFQYNKLGKSVPSYSDGALMQYTGLQDEKGKDIYEGDRFNSGKNTGVIKYIEDGFKVVWDEPNKEIYNDILRFHASDGEVIGNIYENPELIKELST